MSALAIDRFVIPVAPATASRSLGVGAKLAIVAYVLTQFVDCTVVEYGGVPISAQKIAGIIFLPAALLLMGKLRAPTGLVALGAFLGFAYSLAHLIRRDLGAPLWNGIFGLTIGMVTAIVLYTALSDTPASIRYFA